MPINLKGRSFLTLKDFTKEEIEYLLDLSIDLKRKKRAGIRGNLLERKNICLIFEKASTRTRCAFEIATYDEGGNVTFLTNSQMGKKESIEDTAKVLGRFYDGIEFRGYKQTTVEKLAKYSGVPVWNGLTDIYHPTQVLADFITIIENTTKRLNQCKLVFVGDARNNVASSLMIGAAKIGMNFSAVAPKELYPEASFLSEIEEIAKNSGSVIEVTNDLKTGLKGADAVYTDVWVSMGEEDMFEERIKLLKPYKVDIKMLNSSENPNVIFLHCLPSYHDTETAIGKEVFEKYGLTEMEASDEVFRSKYSKVFDEAENRLHTIKAVMVATIGNI